jgi:hypothetical protein
MSEKRYVLVNSRIGNLGDPAFLVDDFTVPVNDLLANGYEPLGPPFVYKDRLFQAVVRPAEQHRLGIPAKDHVGKWTAVDPTVKVTEIL